MRPLSLLLLAAALATGCGHDDDTKPVEAALSGIIATCSNKSGDVQLKRKGEGFWSETQVASVFRAGDWVKTGGRSYARIELLKGGALELDEDATLVLEVDPKGGKGDPLVQVESGSVKGTFTDPSASALRIRMADGSEADLQAQGDQPIEFRIQRGKTGTDITLDKGSASLTTRGEQHELQEGAVTALNTGGGVRKILLLPAPAPHQPAPDATLSFDGSATATLQWSELKAAGSYRLQVARNPSFTDPLHNAVLTDARVSQQLGKPGAYFWRVAALDAEGREGPFSRPQRFFALSRGPVNSLIKPDDRATYAYVDAPPRITFAWNPQGSEASYRLVIARGPDLYNDRIKSEPVDGLAALLEGLEAGNYYWGVYNKDDEPLFVRPYKLSVQRSSKAVLKAPKRINKWGK